MKTYSNPALDNVFKTRDNLIILKDTQANIYQNFLSKILFVTKRERPDTHTTVAFLSPGLRYTYKDNCKKISRIMRYLRFKPKLGISLCIYRTNILKWWVNRPHGVHSNCKGRMVETQELEQGSTISSYTKQNINTGFFTKT